MKNLNHIKIYLSILILWGMKRLNNSNHKKKVIGFTWHSLMPNTLLCFLWEITAAGVNLI